jgi:hypothetical protein
MSADVVVREFTSEVEAALAAATLKANGIHAMLRTVGSGFHTTFAGRTAVVTGAEDLARARSLLDTTAKP